MPEADDPQQGRSGPPTRSGLPAVALWAMASIPVVGLALLASMAIRVRLGAGTWPARDQPDPKTLGWHNTVTVVFLLASFVAVVAVPLGSLAAFAAGWRRIPLAPIALAVVAFAVQVVVLRADLGGLGQWIGD